MPLDSEILRQDSQRLLKDSRQLIEESKALRHAAHEGLKWMEELLDRVTHEQALLKSCKNER
jgi:hypothetical protein